MQNSPPNGLPAGGWLQYCAWRLLPLGAWMGVIFFLSSKPATDYSKFRGTFDFVPFRQELVHGVLYFVFAWLTMRAITAVMATPSGKAARVQAAMAVAAAVLYGTTDEWHQSFVPGRNPSWVGILADGLGATCAAAAWLAWSKWRARRA